MREERGRLGRRVAAVLVLMWSTTSACSRSEQAPTSATEPNEPPPSRLEEEQPGARALSPPVARSAWLDAVRRAHAEVDAAFEGAASPAIRQRALDGVASAFEGTSPLPGYKADPIRQDLACRAARLELSSGRPESARAWAERGLALAQGQPFFRANLLVVLADAERELGRVDAAREHLVQALGINQDLLDRELEEP